MELLQLIEEQKTDPEVFPFIEHSDIDMLEEKIASLSSKVKTLVIKKKRNRKKIVTHKIADS